MASYITGNDPKPGLLRRENDDDDGTDDEWSHACASSITSDTHSYFLVASSGGSVPSRITSATRSAAAMNDGDSFVSAASSSTGTNWLLVGNDSNQNPDVEQRSKSTGHRNDDGETTDSASVDSFTDWSLLGNEFSRNVAIDGKKRKIATRCEDDWFYTYRRVDVLTRRLTDYLTESKLALGSVLAMRLLPEKDLRGLVVKFCKAATIGLNEIPRVRLAFKCTEAGDAAWDGIRWEGFCLGRKESLNRGSVSVSKDLETAATQYLQNESGVSMRERRLEPISESHVVSPGWRGTSILNSRESMLGHGRRGIRRMARPRPHRALRQSCVFRWIVATVEVLDPFEGAYPTIPTRYVRIADDEESKGHRNGSVRLFGSRQNVLPLVCFEEHVEDDGILLQLQEGLMSVLVGFFKEKP
mmetsp:Transcript_25462/g.59636  ORF Transcript_25462/g.59636 Transcript_25462/m.59636 type:complete len:414 (+) Transcript_25462:256-1497(+)